jgi:RNA polymerase sigma factor (sigma-70 family)
LTATELDTWFVTQVVPMEASLMRFLRRNCRDDRDLLDLRQDVYIRVYESAAKGLPQAVKAFVFATARNLLIDRARRAQIVPIDLLEDMDSLEYGLDELTPERHASGRAELLLLQDALQALPPRCRHVVELRKIEGLSQCEVAQRLGISEDTVERHVGTGIRALANALYDKGVRLGTKAFASARAARDTLQ